MVRICAPGIRMLDGKGEPVVYGRHVDGRVGLVLLRVFRIVFSRCALLGPSWLGVLDKPVVVAPVRVPDDVVQDY